MAEINEQLRDDAAAFVLGAMPELEVQAFRREMMKNCDLGRYVEQLELVGDVMLAEAAPPVDVPDAVGAAIMAEARRDLEAREILASPRAGAAAEAPKKSLLDRILKPAAAVAVAAAVALGAFFVGQNASDEVTPSPSTTAAEFKSDTEGMSGSVTPIDGGAKVEVAGMPADLDGDVYELWIQRGEEVTRSTLFTVDSEGNGVTAINEDISDADNVMITREPAGGSDLPTGEVLATASL